MDKEDKCKADEDNEARFALWKAICLASADIQTRFRINYILNNDNKILSANSRMPDVFTWQLIEALSLLCVILKSDDASADILKLFGKTGPVRIIEDGITRYLWAQKYIDDADSGLNTRPDLLVTSSENLPTKSNIIRIIEAKAVNKLGAPTVRSEFGKAYDLRVTNYLIWSFYTPNIKIVEGAKKLGIDIEVIGFDTIHRDDLIKNPDALIARIAYAQDHVRRLQRFSTVVANVNDEISRKRLT